MTDGKDKTTSFGDASAAPQRHKAQPTAEAVPAEGQTAGTGRYLPDFTDIEDVRRAFIASEIFNRKY